MLTATVISLPALADNQTSPMTNSTYQTSFKSYDQNGNGMISQSELQSKFLGNIPSDVFASYDTNNNGGLDSSEFSKFYEKNYQVSMTNQKELNKTKQQNKLIQQKAAATNQALAKQHEMAKAAVEQYNSKPKVKLTLDFIVFDENNDKQIDIQEFNDNTNSLLDANKVYGSYDANNDGKLNITEFKRYVNSDPRIPAQVTQM